MLINLLLVAVILFILVKVLVLALGLTTATAMVYRSWKASRLPDYPHPRGNGTDADGFPTHLEVPKYEQ